MKIDYSGLATLLESINKKEVSSSKSLEKLADLIKSSPSPLVLEAKVVAKTGGDIRLNVSDIGLIDIKAPEGKNLYVGESLQLRLTLSDDHINMTFQTEEKRMALPQEIMPKFESKAQILDQKGNALMRMGLPVSESNLNALSLLETYKIEPSTEKVKNLAEGSFLASKITTLLNEMPEDTLVQKIPMNTTLKQVAVSLLKQVETTTEILPTVIKNENKSQRIETDKPEILEKTNVAINEEGIEKDQQEPLTKVPVETLKHLKTLFNELTPKNLLTLVDHLKEADLEMLFAHKGVQDINLEKVALKHQLFSDLKEIFSELKPSQTLEMELKNWLSKDGEQLDVVALKQLKYILETHAPKALEMVKENLENYQKVVQTVSEYPQFMSVYQVPVILNQLETQVELYIKKKQKRQSEEGFKMLVALNTETLDLVQVFITDQPHQLSLDFKVENEPVQMLFSEALPSLIALLNVSADKRVVAHVRMRENLESSVFQAMAFMGEENKNQIDVKV